MKTIFFLFGTILLLTACQKDLTEKQANSSQPVDFNIKIAQDWYNNTFKNSAEFLEYDPLEKGQKEPNWKKGTFRKTGSIEIIEFPLIKQKGSVMMFIDTTLSKDQFKEIISSSLNRIAFLKNAKNEIFVREFDYVPEYSYLKSKNFKIGDIQMGSANNNFTGSVITKKWNGKMISVMRLQAGKVTSTSIVKPSTNKKRAAPTTTL